MSYPEPPADHTDRDLADVLDAVAPQATVEVDLAGFLPEGVSLASEAAVDTEALAQIERDLDAVDAAIAALDAGTYGTDPATGAPIDDALLAADPTRLS